MALLNFLRNRLSEILEDPVQMFRPLQVKDRDPALRGNGNCGAGTACFSAAVSMSDTAIRRPTYKKAGRRPQITAQDLEGITATV